MIRYAIVSLDQHDFQRNIQIQSLGIISMYIALFRGLIGNNSPVNTYYTIYARVFAISVNFTVTRVHLKRCPN